MQIMKSGVNENSKSILHNKYGIEANQKHIEENKVAISELKSGYIQRDVFESAIARYDRIVHRLIMVLCGVVALLFICNAIWLYAWKQVGMGEKTTITQEGETNHVGG